jgi:hypothetical protein
MNCKYCNQLTSNENFCSRICYQEHRQLDRYRICQFCGNAFIIKNKAYEKRGGGKYCSRTCGTRKFKFNEKFFDKIDTEKKAYWLGFLYADGSQNGNQFQMCLKIDDKGHLEKFKIAIDAEHLVKEIVKKNHKKFIGALFQISSKYFCKSLENQGCVKNKTFIVKFPNIDSNLHRHFIRGVFDGDGTIGIMNKKYGYKKWTIYSASEKFGLKISKILQRSNMQVKFYKRNYKDNRKPGYNVEIHRKNEFDKLYRFLYDGATIFLDRKKDKFTNARA